MKKNYKVITAFMVAVLLCFSFSAGAIKSEAAVAEKVIVGGCSIGVRLYLDGLLVVGESDILSGGKKMCPGESAGIKKGDRITKINGDKIENVAEFCEKIQESDGGEITLGVIRNDRFFEKKVTPICYSETGEYKIGLWVRDSTAGIGTITYMERDGTFAALGHGISDTDTKELIYVKEGDVLESKISSVLKGAAGAPGNLKGTFSSNLAGSVYRNTPQGIFGKLSKNILAGNEVEVAPSEEVKVGRAVIFTNVEGQKVEQFDIEIERILPFGSKDGKNMVIKITDPRLIEKTGGIVQGMSGSPILQDGKLVGAVTHVFVNNPTRGYGIFIENMLSEAEKIK